MDLTINNPVVCVFHSHQYSPVGSPHGHNQYNVSEVHSSLWKLELDFSF